MVYFPHLVPSLILMGKGIKFLKLKLESKVGEVITDKLEIACSNQSIKILEIQRQGKKPQKIAEFLLGSKIKRSVISNV